MCPPPSSPPAMSVSVNFSLPPWWCYSGRVACRSPLTLPIGSPCGYLFKWTAKRLQRSLNLTFAPRSLHSDQREFPVWRAQAAALGFQPIRSSFYRKPRCLVTGAGGSPPQLRVDDLSNDNDSTRGLFASAEDGRAQNVPRGSGRRCRGEARRDAGQFDLRVEAVGACGVRASESPLQVRHRRQRRKHASSYFNLNPQIICRWTDLCFLSLWAELDQLCQTAYRNPLRSSRQLI